ncbi:MAG: hypothetical protein RhofKO_22510 [Rhodothermales bacterium]
MAHAVTDAPPRYVDTPKGLFTASGQWFRTRESQLEAFAGRVLERRPLADLIDDADAVLAWPTTLTVWVLPLLALGLPWWGVVLFGFAILAATQLLTPSMLTVVQIRLARWLRAVWAQGAYYVFMLSLLAQQSAWLSVVVLIVGFIALRWGWAEKALAAVTGPLFKRMYPLPKADQALRSVIVRYALKYRVPMPEIEAMERAILKSLV